MQNGLHIWVGALLKFTRVHAESSVKKLGAETWHILCLGVEDCSFLEGGKVYMGHLYHLLCCSKYLVDLISPNVGGGKIKDMLSTCFCQTGSDDRIGGC